MLKPPLRLTVAALTAVAFPFTAMAQQADPTTSKASDVPAAVLATFPAVVRIYVVAEVPTGGRLEKKRAAGSGAIISPDGYVVTNHHVAGNATYIACNLSDHQEVPARLVGTDALADIAVLKIDTSKLRDPSRPLPTARWGDSDAVRVGDPVFAMGSPAAISQSVTKGIIANDRMIMPELGGPNLRLDGEDNGAIVRWLAHDAVIFGGNSGGPLLNANGEIIGVNEIGFANLSGAIPGNLAKSVVGELIRHGHVPRSWTGLTLQARIEEAPRGALVANVTGGSPAAKAGLLAGDLLLLVGSVATDCRIDEDLPGLNAQLMALTAGETVEVVFLRAGKEQMAHMTLAVRDPAQHRPHEERRLGCTVASLSRTTKERLRLASQTGMVIVGMRTGGPADNATPSLRVDDVILAVGGQSITDGEALASALDGVTDSRALLTVQRQREQLLVAVELGAVTPRRPPARVRRAWLPLRTQVLTPELSRALDLDLPGGVRVTEVLADSTADYPLQVGDIITSFNGKAVNAHRANEASVFRRLFERLPIGEAFDVSFLRDGKPSVAQVTTQQPPARPESLAEFEEEALEFTCRDRSPMDDRTVAVLGGVIVIDVQSGSWADLAGIRQGDRILQYGGETVDCIEQFAQLANKIAAARPAHIVTLVAHDDITRFHRIEPVWK